MGAAGMGPMLVGPWPRHMPFSLKLERLLETGDPAIGYFAVEMARHEARDLLKALFGPKGSKDAPQEATSLYRSHHSAWILRLNYNEPSRDFKKCGTVVVEFYPPSGEGKFAFLEQEAVDE